MIYYVVDTEIFQPVYKISCGDIFGAVFFYTYIKDNDVIKSLKTTKKADAAVVSNSDFFYRKSINSD
jgi:hypothetical protein